MAGLEIHGTGEEHIILPNLGDPLELRKALQEAIGRASTTTQPVSNGASRSGLRGIAPRPNPTEAPAPTRTASKRLALPYQGLRAAFGSD